MRRLLLRCAAVGVAAVLALVLAEGLLRLLDLAPTSAVVTDTETEFRSIPGIWSPGQDVVDRRNPRFPFRVATDSLGYRGPGFPLEKEPGEFRILFAGDSYAFGDFVNDDQTLPARLEWQLRRRCGHVRVVNAGLDAATILDEAQLVERGLRVSPDLVVLLFSENDVSDLGAPSVWERLAENRRAKSRFPLSIMYPVLRRTALWNLGLRTRERTRVHLVPIDRSAAGEDSVTLRLRETYHRALVSIRDALAARGIPLMLVVYPGHTAITHDTLRGQVAWVTQTAAAAGVPVVNLLTPLIANGPAERLYLLPYDGHPSPLGYEVAAAYLAHRLSSSGPLAGASCGRLRRTEADATEGGLTP